MDSEIGRPSPLLIYGITLSGVMMVALVAPALPDVLETFGRPARQAGLLLAAPTVPGIVLAPVAGLAADRWGRRALLLPSVLLYGASGVLCMVAPNFEALIIMRLVQGLGGAGLINLAITLIADNWDGVQRTRLIGRNVAVMAAGLTVLPALGGAITQFWGWRWVFGSYALAIVLALPIARWSGDDAPKATGPESWGRLLTSTLQEDGVARVLLAAIGAFVLVFGVFFTVIPVYAASSLKLDPLAIGAILSLPAVVDSAFAWHAQRLQSWAGMSRIVMLGSLGFGLGMSTLLFYQSSIGLLFSAAFLGVGQGCLFPALQILILGRVSRERHGTVSALWIAAVRVGQTIGPIIASFVFELAGITAVSWGGVIVAVAMLILLMPIWRTRAPAQFEHLSGA